MPNHPDQPSRLSLANLVTVRAGTSVFAYDKARLQSGIAHIGLGAFARAHICDYTDAILNEDFGPWGIAGINLRNPDQRDRLAPQDWLYTAINRDADVDTAKIIGAITQVLAANDDAHAIAALLASPEIRIVSLTVTEKGYCHDPAGGRLSEHHPDIQHDLNHPRAPKSVIGVLTSALARRRDEGSHPFTVLCCDNLPHNGALVAQLVQDFAALRNDKLARWIETNVAFPSTMVDRIVPATTPRDLVDAVDAIGLTDAAPVIHEPFKQWVIEDRFVDGKRPAWQRAGATLVADVAPFEAMKLRLLNASHSALAYLGYLGGHETIGDCVSDPTYRAYVEALWREEIIPVTPAPPATDLHAYARQLLARYDNPSIRHRVWQIAMDGSQKLPQRLLATTRLRLARNLPIVRLAYAIAAWMIYVGGVDERGQLIDVRDPLADTFRRALANTGPSSDARVAALIGIDAVFGPDLGANAVFRAAVAEAYDRLRRHGARQCVATLA